MNGRNTSDVHNCVAKWSIYWDGTFCSEVIYKIVVKLNTGCVQNVVTTWRGRLGRPRLGTDTEDSFFPGTGDPALGLTQRILFFLEPVTLTPTWMRSLAGSTLVSNNWTHGRHCDKSQIPPIRGICPINFSAHQL